MTALLLAGGFVLLLAGAELLVRGASRLAAAFSVPPLVVGLTVVAFGTSAPELAVSIEAATSGRADLALGNVVGSNIFNVLCILGLSALITPLAVSRKLVRLEVPILVAASLLLVALGWNETIGRAEGALLVVLGLVFTILQVQEGRREGSEAAEPASPGPATSGFWLPSIAGILVGLALLVLGSRWLVDGAVAIARGMGISELVIGLTVVAAGTSLPELATSVLASLRGERDIAVGNVVGSNLFNIFWVLGLASMVSEHGVRVPPETLRFDLPVLVGAALACLPIFFTGLVIARWEGGLFLAYYLAYGLLLGLAASHSPSLLTFQTALLGFAGPLTLLTLGILALRSRKRG